MRTRSKRDTLKYVLNKIGHNGNEWTWWYIQFTNRILSLYYRGASGVVTDNQSIVDRNWDTMIILDGCRFDVFRNQIATQGSYFNDLKWSLEKIESGASCSPEFLVKNFASKKLPDTVFVSSNSYLTALLPKDTFFKTLDLWKTHWNDIVGTVLPEDVAKEGLKARERYPNKRLIIQFLQPHGPFIGEIGNGFKTIPSIVFRQGRDRAVQAYISNLCAVFPYVQLLISRLDGVIIVTSDHGEALGEKVLGIPVYGHPRGSRMPALMEVPWLTIYKEKNHLLACDNKNDYSDDHSEQDRKQEGEIIKNRLGALGYS
jgi:hypothetical protein